MPEEPERIPLLRPPRADAQKNRQRLLVAAEHLFSAYGVESVTMSDVAEAAGVGKGTLYRHFSSKTELCHALLDQDQRELQNTVLQRLHNAQTPPLDDLRWFLEQASTFVYRNLSLLYVARDPGAPMTLDFPGHRWWRQTIRALLQRAGVTGDLDYIADTLYVMIDAQTLRYQQVIRGYDLARIHAGLRLTVDRLTHPE